MMKDLLLRKMTELKEYLHEEYSQRGYFDKHIFYINIIF